MHGVFAFVWGPEELYTDSVSSAVIKCSTCIRCMLSMTVVVTVPVLVTSSLIFISIFSWYWSWWWTWPRSGSISSCSPSAPTPSWCSSSSSSSPLRHHHRHDVIVAFLLKKQCLVRIEQPRVVSVLSHFLIFIVMRLVIGMLAEDWRLADDHKIG